MCIVQELMEADVRSYFCGDIDLLTETNVRKLFHQMAQAIAYCHRSNVIHRDVKLENFLIKKAENGEYIIKLADFGIACEYYPEEENRTREKSGSLLGVAPEILTSDQFCPKIDCWALGVILYELLTAIHPFFDRDS